MFNILWNRILENRVSDDCYFRNKVRIKNVLLRAETRKKVRKIVSVAERVAGLKTQQLLHTVKKMYRIKYTLSDFVISLHYMVF